MYLKKAILLLLAWSMYVAVNAQTSCSVSLNGKIQAKEGQPVSGAIVVLNPGNLGASSNAQGLYVFNNLCRGKYTISIQFVGYRTISVELELLGDKKKNFTLLEDVTELNEVVIQHHDAAHTEHATNFAQLEERALSEAAGKSLGETLKEIPGVTSLQTGPGVFKPVIHGLHSQRLLILNHGIRQEGQQWGAEHAPEIDPFIASNIVVVKDASAIKYGTDALGGVIIVNPAPLPESNTVGGMVASVLQSNGRSGTLSGMLEGGIKNKDGWGWRVQGTVKRTGDFETPDYVLTNTGIRELNFSSALGYHKDNFGVDVFFSRFQSEIGILRGTTISNLDDLVNAMERTQPLYTADFSYEIGEPRQEVSHNLLKLNGHISGESGEWRFQYGFQNNNRKEFDLRISSLSELPAIDLKLNTHTFESEWETHHSESRTISFGMNTIYQTNKNIPGTQRIPFIPNFENLTGGVFATSKFFFRKWTIDGGVRYDYRNSTVKGFDFKNSYYTSSFDFGNISAALGITHKVSTGQELNLNVSTAWRPPHVSELYSVGTHQSAAAIEYGFMLDPETNEVRDINDLKFLPEQAVKVVGSYRNEGEKHSLGVTAYANYISNYIYLRPQGITRTVRGVYPYFRYEQTDALFIGADVDAKVKVHRHVTATPRLSLLKTEDVVNDTYFIFIPSNRYSLSMRYGRPELFTLGNVYVESAVQYVARQTFSPRVVTVRQIQEAEENGEDPFNGDPSIFDFVEAPKGYALMSAALGFSIKSNKVQYDLRLSAENLLSQNYREYTNRFRYYADDLGRNIMFSLKCIF